MTERSSAMRLGLALALLMLAFAIKGLLIGPPPAPTKVAEGQFDTARAIGRLDRILGDQRPHPVDTPANDAVRARLIGELRAIGLTPQVREASDCRAATRARIVSCSHVRNVVATVMPATRAPGAKRLLLNSHYDSSPAGPGAADDGIGVAVMIEVAALLRASPPPRPVTFLFNEGEEYGLNGASAFARDPLAREVDLLINIESRGVAGPAMMFETSSPNGPAMVAYRAATRAPSANSISTDMATLIPNSTDVEVLKGKRWTTLSYAIIGNETRYHSPGDTVAALSRDSVAQMGGEVLSATRTLAAAKLGGGGRRVFTDVAGLFLLSLPLWVAAGGVALLLAGTALVARREEAVGRPLLAVALAWLAGAGGAVLVALLLGVLRPGPFWNAWPLVVMLALYAVIVVVEALLLARSAARVDRDRLRTAAWLLVMIVAAAASLALPGATIFFLVAPALALAGLWRRMRWLVVTAALVQLAMIAQLLALVELLLVDGPLWAVAPLAALAALPVLVEVAAPIARPMRLALIAAALVAGGAALAVARTSGDRPGGMTIDYVRDDVAGKAHWSVSNELAPLPVGWERFGEWRKATLRNNKAKRWLAPAPLLPLPTPKLAVTSMVADGAGRRVGLTIDRGGFDAVTLRFVKGVRVTAMGLAGNAQAIPKSAGKDMTVLRCAGRSCDGMRLEIRFADRRPATADLIGSRYALPPQGAPLVAARPKGMIPHYAPNNSVRIVAVRI